MNHETDEAEEGAESREEPDRYSTERLEQLEFGLAELENREARLLHEKAQWYNQRRQLIQYLENLNVQDNPQNQAMLSDLMNILDPKVDKSEESIETHAESQIEQSHVEYDENPDPISTEIHPQTQNTTSISEVVIKSLKHITGLFENKSLDEQDDVPVALWQDELGRLRLWAANIGAHQRGESSLDHRLREASHIKDQTLRLLERLQRAAQDLEDALQGSESDDDFLGEESEEEETELQSIYHTMHDTIDNLFQMSMLIRRPAQHDRLFGTKRADAAPFEHFDRQHVESKYPQADHSVLNRLGLAISQRRAVMRYRERHHIKLAQGLGQAVGDQPDTVSTKLSETVATDFIDIPEPETEAFESLSIASETSYARTIIQGGDGMTLPPPPKESADGAPFECPYCFVIISINKPNAWARHVFNDIMPYLCIFPDCSTPHRLYESRREWFSHLQDKHSIVGNANMTLECTLCKSSVPSGKQFERHVGRHLEELALFALPRSDNDGDEDALPSDVSEATSEVEVDIESQIIREEPQGEEQSEIKIQKLSVPEKFVKCFIGHDSARLNEICSHTSTSISIAKYSHDETGERMFTIKGGDAKVQAALFLIYETLQDQGAFDGESRHHELESTLASPQTQHAESSNQEALDDVMNFENLKETGDSTWGPLKQEIEGNIVRFRQRHPQVEKDQDGWDTLPSTNTPPWNPDSSQANDGDLPSSLVDISNIGDHGPFNLEELARMDDVRQGDTIEPPCDRCFRLHLDCVKSSTACVGCTKINSKCSWKYTKERELPTTSPFGGQPEPTPAPAPAAASPTPAAASPTPAPEPAPAATTPADTAKDEAIARLEQLILDDRTKREAAEFAKAEEEAKATAALEAQLAHHRKIAREAAALARADSERRESDETTKAKELVGKAAAAAASNAVPESPSLSEGESSQNLHDDMQPSETTSRSIPIKYIDSDNPRKDITKDEATKIRAQAKKKDRIWTEIPRKLASREAIETLGYELEETRQHFYVFEYLEKADINELTELSREIQQSRRRKLLNRFEAPEEDPNRSRSSQGHRTSPSPSSDPIPDLEDNPSSGFRLPRMRHPPSQVTDDSDLDGSAEEGDFNNDLQQALDKFSMDLESDRNAITEASANFSSTPNKLNVTRSAADTGSDILSSLGQILGEEIERDQPLQSKGQAQFGGNSDSSTREPARQRSNLEKGSESRNPREHPYYFMSLQSDGKYHCPFNTGDKPCNHPATSQKSFYHQYLDSHLKPYRCKVPSCVDVQLGFSSNAQCVRHEREVHGLHGHPENPHLCLWDKCEQSTPGNGFSSRPDLYQHMRDAHDYQPSERSSSPEISSQQNKMETRPDGEQVKKGLECEYCGLMFKSSHGLEYHIVRKHIEAQPRHHTAI